MSGEFGATAWGHDWLRLAEPTSITRPDPALPRARSLARGDRVRDLELTPGQVTAVVDDRGERRVRITVPTWDDAQVGRARVVLADQPAGADLPDTVHAALRDAGLPLAPDPATLTTTCGCTSRKDPCLHLLATYVELARRLDERPRHAVVLRGLTDSGTPRGTARVPLGLVDPATFYGPSRVR
ncbi:MAG: hypothetical protein JWP48_7498 [Actinoallomurus sp.]|nr:hypothetical protein [Actinoallomurus sp.]